MKFFTWLKKQFLSPKKLLILAVIICGVFIAKKTVFSTQSQKTTYETEIVQTGTLISTISGSGTISSGNSTSVNTKASGVVSKVYVTNGDTVVKGQKIAEVTLDDYAKERQTAAWVTYLEATESVKDATKARTSADIQMWTDRQNLLDAETLYKDMVAGAWNHTTNKEYTYNERAVVTKQYQEAQEAFAASELKYKNSTADIAYAQTKVAAAYRNYQENSSTIYAPVSGTISDLTLAPGIVLNANSSTSSTTGSTIVSTQTVGKISNSGSQLMAQVSLSEIDIIKVRANQKVTLTLDAYPDKTFTGKVLAVNTTGSVSSSVTSYPVTILLDDVDVEVYPNMAVNVDIITNIVPDVLMVPTTAITTSNGTSTVQIKKDNQISTVQVELGSSNDSYTEVKSGLSEGDSVVTSIVTQDTSSTDNSSSLFSGLNRSSGSSSSRNSNFRIMQGPGGF